MTAILIPRTTGLFSGLYKLAIKAVYKTDTLVTVSFEKVYDLINRDIITKVLILTGSRSYEHQRILNAYETYLKLKKLNKKIDLIIIDGFSWPVRKSIIIPDWNIIDRIRNELLLKK